MGRTYKRSEYINKNGSYKQSLEKGGQPMLEIAIALLVLLALDIYMASVGHSRSR
jgi:hypothetical protein